jgi:hypothetical protein
MELLLLCEWRGLLDARNEVGITTACEDLRKDLSFQLVNLLFELDDERGAKPLNQGGVIHAG